MAQQQRFPLNSVGDFYVVNGMCIACTAPEHEAPDLMANAASADGLYHCYFKRQPETVDELNRAVMAVTVGCCGAVRYSGNDAGIIRRIIEYGHPDSCDHAGS